MFLPASFLVLIGTGEEAGTAALLNLAVGLFAVVLLALSLNAYRKTRLRRLLLVTAAFGFFALSVAVRNLEIFVFPGLDVDEVLVTVLELVTLLLFFFALVFRD
jgi:asparagine N-glycosylation enzyme membrane subunit Stt3